MYMHYMISEKDSSRMASLAVVDLGSASVQAGACTACSACGPGVRHTMQLRHSFNCQQAVQELSSLPKRSQ